MHEDIPIIAIFLFIVTFLSIFLTTRKSESFSQDLAAIRLREEERIIRKYQAAKESDKFRKP